MRLTCSCPQSQLCRWPADQPASTKPLSSFGISQTQFCSLRRSKASVLFWQRKQMLWLGDTSLLHFQSNGWALSRSCLHQEVIFQCVTNFSYLCISKKHVSTLTGWNVSALCISIHVVLRIPFMWLKGLHWLHSYQKADWLHSYQKAIRRAIRRP